MADRFEVLRNYVAVVSNGGVNAAADALGIAKSAVSRRLAELESRLGVPLIDRTNRRLELTAVGRDYHRRAVEVLSSLDELDQSVGGERAVAERLTVSADEDLALMVAAALVSFQRVRPGSVIELSLHRVVNPPPVDEALDGILHDRQGAAASIFGHKLI